MPEVPDELEQFVTDELATADSRMTQVPVGVLRNLHRDATAFRRHARQGGGHEAVDYASGLSSHTGPPERVELLPGEADFHRDKRDLEIGAGRPADLPPTRLSVQER
jgi:hypothetical protein